MEGLRLCIILGATALSAMLLKEQNRPIGVLLALFGTGAAIAFAAGAVSPVAEYALSLTGGTDAAVTVMRALGIAYVTETVSGICRDCGEGGIAGAVDTVGRCEILGLSLPLLIRLMEVCTEMTEL